MQFEAGIAREDIIDQYVAAVVTSKGHQSRTLLCRVFSRDGAIWIDSHPSEPGHYAVALPEGATITSSGITAIPYKVSVPHDSEAGLYLIWFEGVLKTMRAEN